MNRWATALFASLTIIAALAGCQEHLVAPPPSFAPPVVHLPPATPLPTTSTRPATSPSPTTAPDPAIATIQPNQLINAIALKPRVPARAWQYIVLHHSDTPSGSALRFHRAHVARGWDMLGYDFVIGNGTETPDGSIEVGPRWTEQLTGAHTRTPDNLYNDFGVGICLVGNFDESRPTAAQIDALARLCAYLMKTYHIAPERILGHRDCKPTNCPGKFLYAELPQIRAAAEQYAKQMP